ncbi:MAG: EAL domain-containing protein [Sedimenticola sp.]
MNSPDTGHLSLLDLFQNKEEFQLLIDSIVSPMAVLTPNFEFIYVNRAYAEADQQQTRFFPGKNHFDLYPNEENEKIFRNVVESARPYYTHAKAFEYESHPERPVSYWDWGLIPFLDDNDNVAGLVLSLVDVSERINAEEALARNLIDQEIIASILHLVLQEDTLDEILQQALLLVLQRHGLGLDPKGCIFLVDRETGRLNMRVKHGLPESIEESCAQVNPGQCICGQALQSGNTIFKSSVDHDHHTTYPDMAPHGHYCTPIKSKGEVLGILNMYVPEGHQHTCEEEQFVNAIADTLAGVILRQQANESLKSSEEHFRSISETAQDAIISTNDKGAIISWNKGAAAIFGYMPDEIFGQPLTKIMPPRYHDRYHLAMTSLSRTGKINQLGKPAETCGLNKDGVEFPIEISLSTWHDTKNLNITGIVRDITERKRHEEQLRQAATVFENATEGVIIADADSIITSVNRAITDITGYTAEEIIGNSPRLWKSQHHDSHFYQNMWSSIDQTGQWKGEIWNRRKDGKAFPCWQTIRAIKDDDGLIIHYVSVMSDITSIKESQEQVEYLAHHDPLTGLPNRLLFNARVDHAIDRANRNRKALGMMFMDIDNFKHINDSLGHPTGDTILQLAASKLEKLVRDNDTVARIGGDEFILLFEDLEDLHETGVIAEKILTAFSEPFHLEDHTLHITTSIGISLYPRDGDDVNTLVRNADTAMYQAKERGKNNFQYYTEEFTQQATERLKIEAELRSAMAQEEFCLHYQPQYSLDSGEIVGAEALLRWLHPETGLVMPDRFIPVIEETGMIIPIGKWVMETACRQITKWKDQGHDLQRISVNVSAIQLHDRNFMEMVRQILRETGCHPSWLEIEVTENLIMQEPEQSIAFLRELREMGVCVAVDDFGTGYSSLSYLKRLPLTKLKIDRSFILEIPDNPDDVAIVNAIIGLGKNLQLRLIAEGVEDQRQLEFLKQGGCNEAQGYHYSRPLSAEKMQELLKPA